MSAEGTPLSLAALEQMIESERAELLQVQALLKCLYEVLLYAETMIRSCTRTWRTSRPA